MRALLAPLLSCSCILALTSTADAARRSPRGPGYYYAPPSYYAPPPSVLNERLVCEERAQAADPSGQYAGYPCWAREAFGRGGSGRGGR
jgi:hypothetical protein